MLIYVVKMLTKHPSLLRTYGFSGTSVCDTYLSLMLGKFALVWCYFQNILRANGLENSTHKYFENSLKSMQIFKRLMGGMNCRYVEVALKPNILSSEECIKGFIDFNKLTSNKCNPSWTIRSWVGFFQNFIVLSFLLYKNNKWYSISKIQPWFSCSIFCAVHKYCSITFSSALLLIAKGIYIYLRFLSYLF